MTGTPTPDGRIAIDMGNGVMLILAGEAMHPTPADAEKYPSPSIYARLKPLVAGLASWLAPAEKPASIVQPCHTDGATQTTAAPAAAATPAAAEGAETTPPATDPNSSATSSPGQSQSPPTGSP